MTEQKLKERLIQQIGKSIVEPSWHFRGSQFFNFTWCGIDPAKCYVRFTVDFKCVKVFIEAEREYGLPDQVCMFASSSAMDDAINWAADRLIEINKAVAERTAPFVQGHLNYQRAIRGE